MRLAVIVVLLGVTLIACGPSDDPGCVAGETMTCACSDGSSGVTTCNDRGGWWSAAAAGGRWAGIPRRGPRHLRMPRSPWMSVRLLQRDDLRSGHDGR